MLCNRIPGLAEEVMGIGGLLAVAGIESHEQDGPSFKPRSRDGSRAWVSSCLLAGGILGTIPSLMGIWRPGIVTDSQVTLGV